MKSKGETEEAERVTGKKRKAEEKRLRERKRCSEEKERLKRKGALEEASGLKRGDPGTERLQKSLFRVNKRWEISSSDNGSEKGAT